MLLPARWTIRTEEMQEKDRLSANLDRKSKRGGLLKTLLADLVALHMCGSLRWGHRSRQAIVPASRQGQKPVELAGVKPECPSQPIEERNLLDARGVGTVTVLLSHAAVNRLSIGF